MVNCCGTRLKFTIDKGGRAFYWHLLGSEEKPPRTYLTTKKSLGLLSDGRNGGHVDFFYSFFGIKNNINDNNKNR